MLRLALAVLAVAIAISMIALVMRGIAREFGASGGLSAVTTGGTMQQVAFFMLLALIVYGSLSGAS